MAESGNGKTPATIRLNIKEKAENLFESKSNGIPTYRIPALVYNENCFLAFCEKRLDGSADQGPMHLVLRRGQLLDTGVVKWDDMVKLYPENNTCEDSENRRRPMNPVPIVVGEDHIILMFNTYPEGISSHGMLNETKYIWDTLIKHSKDGGKTWSHAQPVSILPHFNNRPSQYYCAIGPGHGIKLDSGRLVVAGHTQSPRENSQPFAIVSDDDGKTWKMGGDIPSITLNEKILTGNECQAVEVAPNKVVISCRTPGTNPRLQCYSSDGCDTFGPSEVKPTLVGPKYGCEGSVLGFSAPNSHDGESWVLFSNPDDENVRCNLSVRLSKDGCNTWSNPMVLQSSSSAYSDLTGFTQDGQQKFACLYERINPNNQYDIKFVIFTIDGLK